MDENSKSYMDRLYSIYHKSGPEEHEHHHEFNHDEFDHHRDHGQHMFGDHENHEHHCDKNKITARVLNGVAKDMCMRSIPCDSGSEDELEDDVIDTVDRFFKTHSGKAVQYFTDTKNAITDIIREAIDDAIEKADGDVDDDNDAAVEFVVKNVGKNDDVDEVVDKIEKQIKDSAAEDIKNIINDVKSDDTEEANTSDEFTDDSTPDVDSANESIFHHYLMKVYKESQVPNDPETMLIKPMVETAFHYVTRVLFGNGAREMRGA